MDLPPQLYVTLPGSTSWTQAEEQGTGQTATYFKKTITATSGAISGELQSDGRVKYPLYTYLYETYRNGTLVSSTSSPLYIYLAFNDDGTPTAVYDSDGISGSAISIASSLDSWVLTDTQNPNKKMQTGSVLKGKKTVTTRFSIRLPKRFTVSAPAGAAIACAVEDGESATVAAGTQRDFAFYGLSGSVTVTAQLLTGHTFLNWLRNGSNEGTSPSKTLTVYEGDTLTCSTKITYKVTLIAPAAHTIAYTAAIDGAEQTSGTVSAGATKVLSLTRASSGNMTLVLELSGFSIDTFGGWTKDGTLIDRWSNPATIIANEKATYSCLLTPEPTKSNGSLLCGKYGDLLYADTLKAASSHTIALKARFTSASHNVSCWIWRDGETQTAASVVDNDPSFSASRTLAYPAIGHNTGLLLCADSAVPTIPRLLHVRFHCQIATHQYALTLTVDGTEVYHADNLSGTFSRTIAVS